jgi:hypothetical protein
LATSQKFSLKTFLRQRGLIDVETHRFHYDFKILFDTIVPDLSVSVTSIQDQSILSTELSLNLLGRHVDHSDYQNNKSDSNNELFMNETKPFFGCLVRDQTNKLVVLKEDDSAVASVTAVGIWLGLDHLLDTKTDSNLFQNPIFIGACARYLYSEKLVNKMKDKFILVWLYFVYY